MTLSLDNTLGDLVAHQPGVIPVLDQLHLDWCADGHRSLEEACHQAHLPVAPVLRELAQAPTRPNRWLHRGLDALVRHLIVDHHAPLVAQLDDAVSLAVAARPHPAADEVLWVLAHLRDDLVAHLAQEERMVFPSILAGTTAWSSVNQMDHSHHDAFVALSLLRRLTGRYHAAPASPPAWRELCQALARTDHRLREHLHLETFVLFPRALRAAS